MTQYVCSVEITPQSNPPILKFNILCNDFIMSVWPMVLYNTSITSTSYAVSTFNCIHMYTLIWSFKLGCDLEHLTLAAQQPAHTVWNG